MGGAGANPAPPSFGSPPGHPGWLSFLIWQPECCYKIKNGAINLKNVGQDRILHKRILLADDEPGVRGAIKLLLGIDQHTVVEAANGPEALALYEGDRFDLVITDYEMPEIKGNELAARIKSLLPSQPIIMITAYAEKVDGINNPVDVVLHKPFDFAELRQAIAHLLS